MIILLVTNFLILLKKKIRDCRIYLPFLHFKNNGFEFQRILPPSGKVNTSIRQFVCYKNYFLKRKFFILYDKQDKSDTEQVRFYLLKGHII